jgi:acyl phosphate:glycerol-3-phosphate acyltransferase
LKGKYSPILRAAVHVLLGITIAAALIVWGKIVVAITIAAIAVICFSLEWVRFRRPDFNHRIFGLLSFFIRQEEKKHFTGAFYYLVGTAITAALFTREIAVTAVLFLAFGDPAASLVGNRWGRVRLWGKSLEGDLACFAACFLVGTGLVYFQNDLDWRVILSGSLAAMIIQAIPLRINDNITIPIGAGVVMIATRIFLTG